MGSFNKDFANTWTDPVGINSVSIADAATDITNAISLDLTLGVEVAIEVTYGATVTEGIKVYVLKDVNGTYEAVADNPWGFEMPSSTSTKHVRSFFFPPIAANIKIHITNDSGATVTLARVRIKKLAGVTA